MEAVHVSNYRPILGFDLATCTGFCHGEADECPTLGHFRLPSTGADVGAFLEAAEDRLTGLITAVVPGVVCFESPILPSTTALATTRKLHGLAGMLELVCRRLNVECAEVQPTTVKKVLTGRGNAKKPEMIAAARALGFDPKVEDEADALGVWMTVVRMRHPEAAGRLDPINFMAGRAA